MDFKTFFPHFLWVIRDRFLEFTLEKNGAQVTVPAVEYMLEKVLKSEKVPLRSTETEKASAHSRNETRELIMNLFASVDCDSLPVPDSREEHVKNMARYEKELENQDFLPAVDVLVEKIRNKGGHAKRPWKVSGQEVTGPVLASLITELVEILNDPYKNVEVGSLWDNATRTLSK